MNHLEQFQNEAKLLSSHLKTLWHDYDFEEQSIEAEKRVPKITFYDLEDIECISNNAQYIEGFGYVKFIRRYEVIYRGRKYLFNVSANVPNGCVKEFKLNVSMILDGELTHLLSERL